MGRLKEQMFAVEAKEAWIEVETAAVLGLPARNQLERMTLEAIAALPAGTAISAGITVTPDGSVEVMLRQLGYGFEDNSFTSYLALLAPILAPGARLLIGTPSAAFEAQAMILPEWLSLPKRQKEPRPLDLGDDISPSLPKPLAAWPWDIKRALASIASAGGGQLTLTTRNLKRTARLVKTVSDLHEELVASAYALPEDRNILNGQVNCRAMADDPALLGFEVGLACDAFDGPLRDLVAIALFGTLAGKDPRTADEEIDLRMVAGSRHAPAYLLPSLEDASSLLRTRATRNYAVERPWVLGTASGGIPISLTATDRARHLYVIGATGTGKSTLLKSLVLQDIEAGEGVIVLDPHGDLAEDIASAIPTGRKGDLIYADAAADQGRFAISLLPDAADGTDFEIAADMLVSIFRDDLYSGVKEAFGPMFETYFRNALALLVAAEPSERYLANFPRVFEDREFRSRLLESCVNPDVVSFWKKTALRISGEAELTNITPYITGKLTRFIGTKTARRIFPAAKRCLDFSDLMDHGKILVLRCPKGALGEGLSELAMSACLMKIRSAAMAREATRSRRPVRVYIDEFQACQGNSLQTLLAEGRKFGISLVLANQSLGQIGGTSNRSIGAATLANVGNLLSFRLGAADAAVLSPWLDMPDRWRDLCWLPDFRMNARLLEQGRPSSFYALRSPAPTLNNAYEAGADPGQVLDHSPEFAEVDDTGQLIEGGL